MIILLGASASGKTEVAKLLSDKYGIKKVITVTTRPIRANEIDGIDYFFITKEEFLKRKANGEFVETTEYNGNYYGSLLNQIQKDHCIIVTPNGLEAYLKLNNPIIKTFALTASENTRFNRMLIRGDKLEDAKSRIKNDKIVFTNEKINLVEHSIDTDNLSIEEVCDRIYKIYKL